MLSSRYQQFLALPNKVEINVHLSDGNAKNNVRDNLSGLKVIFSSMAEKYYFCLMLVIGDKLIGADVIEKKFLCNLKACKGACCWEGDWGAPLEGEEVVVLMEIYPKIKQLLSPLGRATIEEKGTHQFYEEPQENGTTLMPNGACAFMTKNELGIAQCGIEMAHQQGLTDFKKPISCHLYPIRIEKNENHVTLNYESWDICSAACELGEKEQLPIYKFLKEPLIRRFGEAFYEELEAAAENYKHWST